MQTRTSNSTAASIDRAQIQHDQAHIGTIPIADATTALVVLAHVAREIEFGEPSNVAEYDGRGLTPSLVDRLRKLTLVDALRHGGHGFGLSIRLNPSAIRQHLTREEHRGNDKEACAHLVRAGASPRLLARLWGISELDVRRMRKLLAPGAVGGRPRQPEPGVRDEVLRTWAGTEGLPERQRWAALSRAYPDYSVAGLEGTVNGLGSA